MRKLPSAPSPLSPSASILIESALKRWVNDSRAQGHSLRTIETNEDKLSKFAWWLAHEEETAATLEALNPDRIRGFLAYLREPAPRGRWGNDRNANARKAMRPASLNSYFRVLRAFGNWCEAEGLIGEGWKRNVKEPRVPKDIIPPLTAEQVQALLDAARRTRAPARNSAIIMLLVDSGLRASEMCSLTVGDCDRASGQITVLGKGNKKRPVYLGSRARRALWVYLETRKGSEAAAALWISNCGVSVGMPMTTSGLFQVVQECGRLAGITGVGPHDLRRTFAVSFLKSGGDVFSLQSVMGHESLDVLRVYVELAREDVEQVHRTASPADRMKLR